MFFPFSYIHIITLPRFYLNLLPVLGFQCYHFRASAWYHDQHGQNRYLPGRLCYIYRVLLRNQPDTAADDHHHSNRIFDMGRTTVNITGDANCCMVVTNFKKRNEKESLNGKELRCDSQRSSFIT